MTEYGTFEYGTGVEYGSASPPSADVLFVDLDTPAKDLLEISTSVEFVVNDAYLSVTNYTIIDLTTNEQVGVRQVLKPFNSQTSDLILLVVDKSIAGREYSITVENIVQRNGVVQPATTSSYFARDAKANSIIAAVPDHFNTDPKVSTMRHIIQAITVSDDKIGSL